MQQGARIAAAIELLDQIIIAARDNGPPADRIIREYFKTRRYAGSKDRRAVAEYVWEAVRRFGERPESGRSAMLALADDSPELAALFDGEGHAPQPISDQEARATGGTLPEWVLPHLVKPDGGLELTALLDRAPLDARVNLSRGYRDEMLVAFEGAEKLEQTPAGLRLPTGTQLEQNEAWRSGLLEVQDLGSQLISIACEAEPSLTVLDLCAGAGGKTLALADYMMLEGELIGRLIASDTARVRLSKLQPRAQRSGFTGIETLLLDPGKEDEMLADLVGMCDIVLVDAPCSGSGTWRRNPETRWRLSPERLAELIELQAVLLDRAAGLVKPGGALIYAVCALTDAEGADQMESFYSRQSDFARTDLKFDAGRAHGAGRLLTSCHDGSDGFFVARAKKTV